MPEIIITTIPHARQRYDTVGDWQWRGDDLIITISDTGSWRSNMAVAIHELCEVALCKDKGITQIDVDKFDMGPGLQSNDPGDLPNAPYRDQHCFATAVERMLIAAFGMAWSEHEILCNSLSYKAKA